VPAARESLKGVWSTTSLLHINRIVRKIVTRKWINDSLDDSKAYQLHRSLGMRKAIKDALVFFSVGIQTCGYRHLSEKDWGEGI
jgi:hypothetical protein